MRIIIDILTPKQCMFFPRLSKILEQRGHQVYRTTRRYREVLQLLKLKNLEAKVIGEHGGKELADKLRASIQRTLELSSVFDEIRPNVAVSFASPEMARVSFGLKIPHISINDSPHAEAVARLTVPLSERLLTPKMIPKKAWTKYGIASNKIIQYNALDPWVWLKDFEPSKGILKELGLTESKQILTFRVEESFAAYLLGKTQKQLTIIPIIEQILEEKKALQIVAVPRYEEQVKDLREVFKDRIIVPKSTVDGQSLLYYTSIFIGAGGTMSAEAALLGVPTFSCYPGEPYLIESFLVKKRLVTRETDSKKIVEKILMTLNDVDHTKKIQKQRAEKLINNFEDPINVISNEIEKISQQRSR